MSIRFISARESVIAIAFSPESAVITLYPDFSIILDVTVAATGSSSTRRMVFK
jgi:hypothetical protein